MSVEINDVTFEIKNKTILKNVSFSLKPGKVVGLIGQNGAGKSTLFKIIAGLLNPSKGNVVFSEYIDSGSIGYIIEEPMLYPYLTVKEHLEVCMKLHNVDIDFNKKKAYEILNVQNFLNIKINALSLGMKQRLSIAAAVCHNPQVVILDEPTNSLDVTGVLEVRKLIENLRSENKFVIISSHLISEIEKVCDEIIIIDKGMIVEKIDINNIDNIEELYLERLK
ncbi:putative ABC transporter ATP-binding protein YxlF [Paraliobacillus sp. PM-2]|uniref:ABC transporter ATP-binding protein n=1 Tax=Paraliobacillus sp. PM-2 TaxID=1462524 RepID=UPI00061CB7FA|nr:ABC transporter ATP-binding protein [Paraliobacillus sp. PM-2]CQR46047.1 putative ABC transporter ATP-binding protein YxlF [Paraliobacillus sp. PM-2]